MPETSARTGTAPAARRRAVAPLLAALALLACEERHPPAPVLALRGPLAPFVERRPASLAGCAPLDDGPARECADAIGADSQWLRVEGDTTVGALTRSWRLSRAAQPAAWTREVARLTSAFGAPVRARRAPGDGPLPDPWTNGWRSYCAAWRGADGTEAVLQLVPLVDVGPVRDSIDWRLLLELRRTPIPEPLGCGLRDTTSGA